MKRLFSLLAILTVYFLYTSAPLEAAKDDSGKAAAKAEKSTSKKAKKKAAKVQTLEGGLQVEDLVVGKGEEATPGKTAVVHYTGTLTNGKKFDSSLDRNEPFEFPLGAGRVIKGWDEGVKGMKVGGKRKLVIPPAMGYGSRDLQIIPPNSTLHFEVELLSVK